MPYFSLVCLLVEKDNKPPEFIVYQNEASSIRSGVADSSVQTTDMDEVKEIKEILKEILKDRDTMNDNKPA